jgi:glycosyltransferase involved in cell wall biosynthesis
MFSFLANELAHAGHDIVVMPWDDNSKKPFYPLAPSIKLIPLSLASKGTHFWNGIHHNLLRIRKIRRKIIEIKPDVIVSFLDRVNILTSLAAIATRIPVIVSERIDPYFHPPELTWRFARLIAYHFAAHIIVQTKQAKSYFPAYLRSKTSVIPNHVEVPLPVQFPSRNEPKIAAMGRLDKQKGFDLLIEALARIVQKFPALKTIIIGEGPERATLTNLRDAKGLRDHIEFVGQIANPGELLQQATLFVSPSKFEGFPNALAEAMALGLPVIASDCTGNRDIVRHGIDGEIFPVNDTERLAFAITHLLEHEQLRRRYAQAAKDIPARFPVENSLALWNEVIEDVKIRNMIQR